MERLFLYRCTMMTNEQCKIQATQSQGNFHYISMIYYRSDHSFTGQVQVLMSVKTNDLTDAFASHIFSNKAFMLSMMSAAFSREGKLLKIKPSIEN